MLVQGTESEANLARETRRAPLERGFTLVEQRPEWYDIDPIHIRRRFISIAYDQILSHWIPYGHAKGYPFRFGFRERLRFFRLSPQYRRLLGFDRYSQQPTAIFLDGSTLSLY